ncbi:MAG TPA: S9 family peptidase, partial [Streptosporangiaceae bacterium]|nr:S9 family peptidase [Streptosporangiaceae bacterium]
MNREPTHSQTLTTITPPSTPADPAPVLPRAAAVRPAERTNHGDTVVDPYAWLAHKDDPEVIAYLETENAYTDAMTGGQAKLAETLFSEIKGRTQETDLSVPSRRGDWWYYTRTAEGQQYPTYCRRPVLPGQTTPPVDAAPGEDEQVLLDCNELAKDKPFFSLGVFNVSPGGHLLAYSTDLAGNERFTLQVKNLVTGETAPDEVHETYYGCAWTRDSSALYYTTVDAAWRPNKLWRHVIGTPASEDEVVFTEPDERFRVSVHLTRSERYVVITAESSLTSEVWLADAQDPTARPRLVLPRRHGVKYSVEDQSGADGGRLLILHNDDALNFTLASLPLAAPMPTDAPATPLASPADLVPLIAHRDDTRLLDVDAFAGHFVLHFRRDGLTGLRIYASDGTQREVGFPEPIYAVSPGSNPEYSSGLFRLYYESLATPDSVYDADISTGELTLLKRRPVLPLPGRGDYDPTEYEQHREWATASDGTAIPISLICRKGTPLDNSSPLMLYGYGSYEHSIDPYFSISRLSLLDRGFVFAIAHVRGGGELGRRWYEDGKLLHKTNTFTDFVACAAHLVATGWTSASRLVARGGSAGGLLMGAAANLAP